MSIRITGSTLGQGNPSPVGAGKPYRWRGHADWEPNHPRYRPEGGQPAGPLPQNKKAIAGRTARLAEYGRLRLEEGLTRAQAAERLGVCLSTSHLYEREFQEQQQGGSRDG